MYIISQSKNDKPHLSYDPFFNFDARNHISGTAEATVAEFCMQVEYIKCLAFDDRLLSNGRGQGDMTRFLILPESYLWNW